MKCSFVPKDNPKPKYMICNADESEPGTFKDRLLIEKDPHALIEGTLIAAFGIQSHTAFIYIRGEMAFGTQVLERAADEVKRAGLTGKNIFGSGYDLDLIVHRGAGAYISHPWAVRLSDRSKQCRDISRAAVDYRSGRRRLCGDRD
jgi:NADH-quinone oxidoreductase subunit F